MSMCLFAFLLVPVLAAGQHEYPATDVENGGRLFIATCATCHGPDGDAVPVVDLGRGKFRSPYTDADLVRIIRTGIPNTGMPPNNISEVNAGNIVAYLRSVAADTRSVSAPGNPERGQAVFEGKGACGRCHRIKGTGGRMGPDLSEIGGQRRVAELERSIVEPNAEVVPNQRAFRIVTREGVTVEGRLLNHDRFTVQMLDSKEQLRSFQKANLREYDFVNTSPMPSYRDTLSTEELADVVSYLVSLKGQKP